MPSQLDRALGCLLGGALGDAMGMPTQGLSADAIASRYGKVETFTAPFDGHPVSHGLPAGSITDDTEQTLLLAETILASPDTFDGHAWARKLSEWENDMRRRGRHDLLGPSTKRALIAIAKGEPPEQAGRFGDTNGAAMRIAPVGIAHSFLQVDAFVAKVHDDLQGDPQYLGRRGRRSRRRRGCERGDRWSELGWRQGGCIASGARRKRKGPSDRRGGYCRADRLGGGAGSRPRQDGGHQRPSPNVIGTSVATRESVPAAFAVVEIAGGNAWEAAVISANLGGDTDTIGAIAAGMAGALCGVSALPANRLEGLNGLDRAHVERLAQGLLAVRNSAERAVA